LGTENCSVTPHPDPVQTKAFDRQAPEDRRGGSRLMISSEDARTELLAFIKDAYARGLSRDQIADDLIAHGYTIKQIADAVLAFVSPARSKSAGWKVMDDAGLLAFLRPPQPAVSWLAGRSSARHPRGHRARSHSRQGSRSAHRLSLLATSFVNPAGLRQDQPAAFQRSPAGLAGPRSICPAAIASPMRPNLMSRREGSYTRRLAIVFPGFRIGDHRLLSRKLRRIPVRASTVSLRTRASSPFGTRASPAAFKVSAAVQHR
jgi:hypothetical protein